MDTKICTICTIEKDINNFYKKYTECIDCNRARGLKRYYDQLQECVLSNVLIVSPKKFTQNFLLLFDLNKEDLT